MNSGVQTPSPWLSLLTGGINAAADAFKFQTYVDSAERYQDRQIDAQRANAVSDNAMTQKLIVYIIGGAVLVFLAIAAMRAIR
jgi:hypothetical protein